MPLFRFHRGGLQESLNTTVIVKDRVELMGHILNNSGLILNPQEGEKIDVDLKVEPYTDEHNNFDPRIGWYTHIVLLSLKKEPFYPIGFLSEPL